MTWFLKDGYYEWISERELGVVPIPGQELTCDGCEGKHYGHTCCPYQTCEIGYCDCPERYEK